MVKEAIIASEKLSLENINCSVINARFIKPLDEELILNIAKKVKYVATIEEGILAGGFGSAILELLNQNKIYKPVIRMGISDEFIEQGTRNELLKECKLTSEDIIQTIKDFEE